MANPCLDAGHLTLKEVFTDGTKQEANANRYTFVWGNAIKTCRERIKTQLKDLWAYTEKMSRSSLSYDELQKLSARITEVTNMLEEKELRWLELSEFM